VFGNRSNPTNAGTNAAILKRTAALRDDISGSPFAWVFRTPSAGRLGAGGGGPPHVPPGRYAGARYTRFVSGLLCRSKFWVNCRPRTATRPQVLPSCVTPNATTEVKAKSQQ